MANFVGLNDGGHKGFHALERIAASWPITAATPEGPAALLKTSRETFAYGYYAYALLAVSGTWSIFAIEAALRARFNADEKTSLSRLVKRAEQEGLMPPEGWHDERLDAGRQLRNRTVHGGRQEVWTPGMAERIVRASHEAVAALFPDHTP